MLLFIFFHNIIQNFMILNVNCFCVWGFTVPTVDTWISLHLQDILSPLCHPVILYFAYSFIFNWKTSFKDISKSIQK
jgi:hypothetical protein